MRLSQGKGTFTTVSYVFELVDTYHPSPISNREKREKSVGRLPPKEKHVGLWRCAYLNSYWSSRVPSARTPDFDSPFHRWGSKLAVLSSTFINISWALFTLHIKGFLESVLWVLRSPAQGFRCHWNLRLFLGCKRRLLVRGSFFLGLLRVKCNKTLVSFFIFIPQTHKKSEPNNDERCVGLVLVSSSTPHSFEEAPLPLPLFVYTVSYVRRGQTANTLFLPCSPRPSPYYIILCSPGISLSLSLTHTLSSSCQASYLSTVASPTHHFNPPHYCVPYLYYTYTIVWPSKATIEVLRTNQKQQVKMSSPSSNSGLAKESNLLAPNPTPTATSRRGSIPKNTPTWGTEGSEDPASSLRKEMNLVAEAAKRASVAIVVRDLQEFAV